MAEKIISELKGILEREKVFFIIATLLLLVIVVSLSYINIQSSSLNAVEFREIMDDSLSYLEESKNLKLKQLDSGISEQAFTQRSGEINREVKKINETLQSAEIEDDINITESTIESAGNALEGLVNLIFRSENLDDISDEILALSIILGDLKTESIAS